MSCVTCEYHTYTNDPDYKPEEYCLYHKKYCDDVTNDECQYLSRWDAQTIRELIEKGAKAWEELL